MEFAIAKEHFTFREEVKHFLQTEITSDMIARAKRFADGPYLSAEITRKYVQQGWYVPHWPKEMGGRELGPVELTILYEESGYHRVYPGGLLMVAESIRRYGTEEQKRFFLPRFARGELDFTLGISEPNAGSDAANIQMRAELQGDEFVINGQKMWGGRGNDPEYAKNNWHWLVCRTDPTSTRHRGLSLIMVPLTSPGITIQAIYVMGSVDHLEDTPSDPVAAIYYDNVRVPKANLLGELHKGWYQLMHELDNERTMIAATYLGEARRVLDDVKGYLKQHRGSARGRATSQVAWHRIAELRADMETLRHLLYHIASLEESRRRREGHLEALIPASHLASMSKLSSGLLVQRISDFAVEVLGVYGTLCRSEASRHLAFADDIQRLTRWDRVLTIGAGSAEMMRNQIAQRYLGLPREAAPAKPTPAK